MIPWNDNWMGWLVLLQENDCAHVNGPWISAVYLGTEPAFERLSDDSLG